MLSTPAFAMPFFNTEQHSSALKMQMEKSSRCKRGREKKVFTPKEL